MTTFSFSDYNDENEEEELPYDEYLTVKAFLEMHFGTDTGLAVYRQLKRMAEKAAGDVGGLPGLIFNDDGGEFVSFSADPLQEDEFWRTDE
jgi:hypothetical protein